jgi:hypothetical protein
MAQLSYGYQVPRGTPGGLLDLSNHNIVSRTNGAAMPGAMRFGMGVVQGSAPGKDVAVPGPAATAAVFEGVVQCGGTTEHQHITGEVILYPNVTVGVLNQGSIWALVTEDAEPAYGDPLYLVKDGDDAGLFTNDDTDTLALNGRFLGPKDNGIAPVGLYSGLPPAEPCSCEE